MNNPGLTCSTNTDNNKDAVIAISNSMFRDQGNTAVPSPMCRQFNRIMIGTNPAASLAQMTTWASSGMAFQVRRRNPWCKFHAAAILLQKHTIN